jgi:hypothetical protein
MKTIKLFRLKQKNGLELNEFDLSNYKGIKFPTKESMILEIAKMLKKPVSEIQKKKILINAAYKQRFDLFIEKKIVDDMAGNINAMLFNGRPPMNTFFKNACFIKHKYNQKTKTFENALCYKNSINSHIENKLNSIEINENFLKGRKKLQDGTYEPFSKSKYIRWYGKKSWDFLIKKTERLKKDLIHGMSEYVKHWTTPEGKKEIELIEKTLEDLGKIKFEIYDAKGKKIETLYATYKRTNEDYRWYKTIKRNNMKLDKLNYSNILNII